MILPSVLLPTVLRSRPPVIRCHRSVVTTWCMTGLKVWLSVCTGTYARGRPDSQTPLTRQTQKTDWYCWGSKTFTWSSLQQPGENEGIRFVQRRTEESSATKSASNQRCTVIICTPSHQRITVQWIHTVVYVYLPERKHVSSYPGMGKKKNLNNCMMMTTRSSSWVLNNHQW